MRLSTCYKKLLQSALKLYDLKEEEKNTSSGNNFIFDEYFDYFAKRISHSFHNFADIKSLKNITTKFFHWFPYSIFTAIILTVIISLLKKFIIMARCNILPDRQAIFFTLFEDRIRREFPTQSAETMSTMVTAVSHILRPNPERPSIILCLGSSEAKDTCARISRATASVVMSSFQKPSYNVDKVTLNCSNYASSEHFWTFYEEMCDRMSQNNVVLLMEFDQIHPQIATSICHLADDTYAPFPQSIIIVCLDIGNRFNSTQLKRKEPITLAESFLEEKWNRSLDTPSLAEIFSRLTGRTVLIEKESRLNRLTGSLPTLKGCARYSGPQPKLRRRRNNRLATKSDMDI